MNTINLEEILSSQKMAISKIYLQGAVNMGNPIGNDYQKIINAMKRLVVKHWNLLLKMQNGVCIIFWSRT